MGEGLTKKIGYLTGEYPKASHTFILREVSALRDLGLTVKTASIRRPEDKELIGPEERRALEDTFFVLSKSNLIPDLILGHLRLLERAPVLYFKTLALALKTARPGVRGRLWQLFYFAEAGILAHWIRKEEIAHLHNHFADSSSTVAMLAAKLADIPFSLTLHGPAELFEPKGWHLGEKIKHAKFTAVISNFARSQAMLFSDAEHWNKIRIVHCGVQPDRYKTKKKTAGERLRILFVGRLTAIKGVTILLDAVNILEERGVELDLKLIGDGDERAELEDAAKGLSHVHFLGYQSQSAVAEELQNSDLLCLPSFAEGVPVVLMEAMASGLPVIATQVGGVSELVEDGVTGHIVPPGSASHLADAIEDLAKSAEVRTEMGAKGQKVVSEHFDSQTEAARIAALFLDQVEPGTIRPDPIAELG